MLKDARAILIIANNTLKEMIRDRILYIIVAVSVFFIGLSLALGALSFFEQFRITANLGFMCVQVTSSILCIFLACGIMNREMERKTILTLLTRSMHRWHFLFGKAFGILSVVTLIGVSLSLVLSLVLFSLSKDLSFLKDFFFGFYGIFLESFVLVAFSLLVSSFSSLFIATSSAIVFFIIGHWQENLHFFIEKSESVVFVFFSKFIVTVFPNLEKFNWRALVVYKESLPLEEIFKSSIYSLAYFILIMSLALLIFRRKNFD